MKFILLIAAFVVSCTSASPTLGLGRIVGGEASSIAKRPYQASLQYLLSGKYQHTCGASIISSKFLLSAAHCNPGTNLNILYARVGSTSYNSGGQVLKVAGYQSHPNYSRPTIDYDFAVVSFAAGVTITLGPNVKAIPLTSGNDPADNSMVVVSGWGVTSESNSSTPINLREVALPVFNQTRCKAVFSFISSRQVCLGGTPQGGTSACFGDSGGPAVQNGVQYALVSGGSSCSAPNIPGIYARISSVRPWIKSITGI